MKKHDLQEKTESFSYLPRKDSSKERHANSLK